MTGCVQPTCSPKFISIWATSARVAVPWGSRTPFPLPESTCALTAQLMAVCAQSEMLAESLNELISLLILRVDRQGILPDTQALVHQYWILTVPRSH